MKENITIIDYILRCPKTKPEDYKKLLSIQIKLNKLEKENRVLRDMVNKSNTNNYYFSLEVSQINSKLSKNKSDMLVLKEKNKALEREIESINNNLDI